MRIAFDLDDTLIPGRDDHPHEPTLPLLLRPWFPEQLRRGAIGLLKTLKRDGHSLWIYTTSNRDPWRLWCWFVLQSIWLDGIVNYDRHESLLRQGRSPKCSKYPPAFGIDLLVDDSDGVAQEGHRHGFRVLVIDPTDANWANRVLTAIRGLP